MSERKDYTHFFDKKGQRERIVIDGYRFRFSKNNTYKCCLDGCKCRAKVLISQDNQFQSVIVYGEHSPMHDREDEEMKSKRISELKKAVEYSISHPYLKYDQVIKINKYTSINTDMLAKRMWRFKSKLYIPTSFKQLIEQHNHPLLLAYCESRIIIFGQPSGIFLLSLSDTLLMDATFNIVSGIGQMLIVHCIHDQICVACLYIVMTRKSKQDYMCVCDMINKLGKQRGLNIMNRKIIIKTDFELSLINGIEATLKYPVFSGCFFHYCQSIIRKVNTLQLMNLKKNNVGGFGTLVSRITALCLLPLKYIGRNTLKLLFSKCTLCTIQGVTNDEKQKYNEFEQYMLYTWIGYGDNTTPIDPVFQPKGWNVCEMEVRTNNYCEALHNLMNKKAKPNSSILEILEVIKTTIDDDREVISEHKVRQKKNIVKKYNMLLNEITKKVSDAEMDILTFLSLASRIVKIRNKRDYNAVELDCANYINDEEVIEKMVTNYYGEDFRHNDRYKKCKVKQIKRGVFNPVYIEPKPEEITLGHTVNELKKKIDHDNAIEIDDEEEMTNDGSETQSEVETKEDDNVDFEFLYSCDKNVSDFYTEAIDLDKLNTEDYSDNEQNDNISNEGTISNHLELKTDQSVTEGGQLGIQNVMFECFKTFMQHINTTSTKATFSDSSNNDVLKRVSAFEKEIQRLKRENDKLKEEREKQKKMEEEKDKEIENLHTFLNIQNVRIEEDNHEQLMQEENDTVYYSHGMEDCRDDQNESEIVIQPMNDTSDHDESEEITHNGIGKGKRRALENNKNPREVNSPTPRSREERHRDMKRRRKERMNKNKKTTK